MPTYKRRTSVRHKRNVQRLRTDRKKRNSPALINTLNNDCLENIFGYLPIKDKLNVQAVCRHWRKNRQLAWRDVRALNFNSLELIQFSRGNGVGVQRILKECGCYLHELTMRFVVPSHILPFISEYCRNLTRLNVALNFSDTTCAQWFLQMQKLKYLRFQAASQHFSEIFFQTLPHESLTELHLLNYFSGHQYPLPPVASNALEKLEKLSALTLRGFSLTPNMLTIINQKTSLTHLSLENCTTDEREPPHLNHLTKLEHLDLSMFSGVNNRLLTEISDTCKSLKFLDLSSCYNVSNEGITKLQILPQLEELILNDVIEISDEPLSKLQILKKLECTGCYNVGDNGIIRLIKYAPRLEYLDLTRSNVSARMLTEAAEVLKQRMNEVMLEVDVDRNLKFHWSKDDCPPLLVVAYDYARNSGNFNSDSTSDYCTSDSDSRNSRDFSDTDDSSDSNDTSDTDQFNGSSDTSDTDSSCDSNGTGDDDEIEDED